MIEYPIMFADLRADSQVGLLEHMGVKHQKDMNWDVVPICVIPRPEPTYTCKGCQTEVVGSSWCESCTDEANKKVMGELWKGRTDDARRRAEQEGKKQETRKMLICKECGHAMMPGGTGDICRTCRERGNEKQEEKRKL